MPDIHPFNAIRYTATGDISRLVAPPYDVLDEVGKHDLLAGDPANIVGIDLPHMPPKELGPSEAYAAAGEHFRAMLGNGTLVRSPEPVMFAYRQTWSQPNPLKHGAIWTFSRAGLACCVPTVPFGPRTGGGILPHEETFSGPKQDRLALTMATGAQLSPIFGLHADETGRTNRLLGQVIGSREPAQTARTADGTLHESWPIRDASLVRALQESLAGEDVFIADGHHRYNTALNYLSYLQADAPVPESHPARRTMMVLVGMSDPGLVIWPTHRVLGGMREYSFDRFVSAAAPHIRVQTLPDADVRELAGYVADGDRDGRGGPARFGLYDYATRRAALATPLGEDLLAERFPEKAPAWRALPVAFIQHVLVEQVCQPVLNAGQPVQWAFPHTVDEVEALETSPDFRPQLAILVPATPISAVREISRAGQLMPQKSTFFYPKLATGMFINPLK